MNGLGRLLMEHLYRSIVVAAGRPPLLIWFLFPLCVVSRNLVLKARQASEVDKHILPFDVYLIVYLVHYFLFRCWGIQHRLSCSHSCLFPSIPTFGEVDAILLI